VPNPQLELHAGLFAEAEIIVNPDEQAIIVPRSAVSRFAGVQKVWIVAEGKAKQQTIRTGREDDNRVEILDGLEVGMTIVLNASEGHDGPVVGKEAHSDTTPENGMTKVTSHSATSYARQRADVSANGQ
jgi:multidrug efflux pump subunit AcrA (membrane-fusion protein)